MATWVYGDIHGAGQEFAELVQRVHRPGDSHISVGDAFDRGRHARLVWSTFQHFSVRMTLGNHEKKALEYLTGKRKWLPEHYYFAYGELCRSIAEDLHTDPASPRVRTRLIEWLSSLPRIIQVSAGVLVTHAGVDINDPWRVVDDANVYGNMPSDRPMPRPVRGGAAPNGDRYWWDLYQDSSPLVLYGHLVTDDGLPRVRRTAAGVVNSVGLDTFVVHGGPMSGYCVETGEVVQYRSGRNWCDETRRDWKKNPPKWR